MRKLLNAFALIAMLAWPTAYAGAQEVTASCKDATSFTGSSRRGACARQGGVLALGAVPAAANAVPTAPAPASSSTHNGKGAAQAAAA